MIRRRILFFTLAFFIFYALGANNPNYDDFFQ
jgi:hypothetical protein